MASPPATATTVVDPTPLDRFLARPRLTALLGALTIAFSAVLVRLAEYLECPLPRVPGDVERLAVTPLLLARLG